MIAINRDENELRLSDGRSDTTVLLQAADDTGGVRIEAVADGLIGPDVVVSLREVRVLRDWLNTVLDEPSAEDMARHMVKVLTHFR